MSVIITKDSEGVKPAATDTVTKIIVKKLLSSAGLSLTKAIKLINEMHPDDTLTPQNISNKLSRDSINFTEVVRIAEVCGYQVTFQPINKPDADPEDNVTVPEPVQPHKEKTEPEVKPAKKEDDFVTYAAQGYAACKSTNFYSIVVAGKEAEKAAQWIESNIDPEMTAANELVVILAANRQFDVIAKPIGQVDSQFTIF